MAIASRLLEAPVRADLETEHELGSPELFGQQLRTIRIAHGKKLAEWAEAADTDASALSRYERGEQRPPTRETLVNWAKAWQIKNGELIDLLVMAGYLPVIPGPLWQDDRQVLLGAMREIFGPGGETQPRGRLESLRSVIASLWEEFLPPANRVGTARMRAS